MPCFFLQASECICLFSSEIPFQNSFSFPWLQCAQPDSALPFPQYFSTLIRTLQFSSVHGQVFHFLFVATRTEELPKISMFSPRIRPSSSKALFAVSSSRPERISNFRVFVFFVANRRGLFATGGAGGVVWEEEAEGKGIFLFVTRGGVPNALFSNFLRANANAWGLAFFEMGQGGIFRRNLTLHVRQDLNDTHFESKVRDFTGIGSPNETAKGTKNVRK